MSKITDLLYGVLRTARWRSAERTESIETLSLRHFETCRELLPARGQEANAQGVTPDRGFFEVRRGDDAGERPPRRRRTPLRSARPFRVPDGADVPGNKGGSRAAGVNGGGRDRTTRSSASDSFKSTDARTCAAVLRPLLDQHTLPVVTGFNGSRSMRPPRSAADGSDFSIDYPRDRCRQLWIMNRRDGS